jgi:hypothetical protein
MKPHSEQAAARKSSRTWRFSLRTLLLVVVVAAIGAALVGRLLRQRAVVAELRTMGVDVDYDSGIQTSGEGEGGQVQSFTKFEGEWVLENDLIYDVHAVLTSSNNPDGTPKWWSPEESRQALKLTAELPDLRRLMLNRCVVRKPEIAQLPCLPHLTELIMYNVDVRDPDLEPLRRARNLVEVQIYHVPVGDEAIGYLEGLENIEMMDLSEIQITDAGLATLSRLPRLRELHLLSDRITDRGLVALSQCQSLRTLHLGCKNIGDQGAREIELLVGELLGNDEPRVRLFIVLGCPARHAGEEIVPHFSHDLPDASLRQAELPRCRPRRTALHLDEAKDVKIPHRRRQFRRQVCCPTTRRRNHG